jgi:hypothetical protein
MYLSNERRWKDGRKRLSNTKGLKDMSKILALNCKNKKKIVLILGKKKLSNDL